MIEFLQNEEPSFLVITLKRFYIFKETIEKMKKKDFKLETYF